MKDYIKQRGEESWDKMYDLCNKTQEEQGELGLGDIADIHEELLKASMQGLVERIREEMQTLLEYAVEDEVSKERLKNGLSSLLSLEDLEK